MKRVCCLVLLMLMLSGCGGNDALEEAMTFREQLLKAESCSFHAQIAADYGDSLQQFSMDCQADATGKLTFTIAEPESIAGICGNISAKGGNITFEEENLHFPLLTDDLLTPASAPWIFLKILRSGYITAAGWEEEELRITMDDSYEEEALKMDVWLAQQKPVRGEIRHDGRRILSLTVENFICP